MEAMVMLIESAEPTGSTLARLAAKRNPLKTNDLVIEREWGSCDRGSRDYVRRLRQGSVVLLIMTFNKMGTLPLPLALHLATYTVIGLFCAFAGGLNLIDPTKIFPNAVIFLGLAGFSWGYVFGILMARKEVLGLGLLASIGYVVAGIWQLGPHWPLGALLLAIGVYGLAAIALYRRQILEA